MAANTITSANSVFMLSVDTIFPTPIRLHGYGPDDAFDSEMVDLAEVQVGVDGENAAGWVPRMVTQTVTFMASSESIRIFEDWVAAQDTIREVYRCNGSLEIPSIHRIYTLERGVLTRAPMLPSARRVLQARQFAISWAKVTPADTA